MADSSTIKPTSLGLTSTGHERDKLNKLLNIFDDGKINLGDKLVDAMDGDVTTVRMVKFKNVKKEDAAERPKMTQRVKTFYVDAFPDYSDTFFNPRSNRNLLGGTPITLETAMALRSIVFGNTVHSFSTEWRKSSFAFYDINGPLPFGLQTLRCGSRALVLCIQGYLLKYLVFDRQFLSLALARSALFPNEYERRRALISAMCQILWAAGDRKRCCVCLQQEGRCYPVDYHCRDDGVTEKLVLFEFRKYQDLEMFIKRQLGQFQQEGCNGCILFLYSLVLSKTVHRVLEDMQTDDEKKQKLLHDNEDCSQTLINLMVTGRATPYLHNGVAVYNSSGQLLPKPIKGVKDRCDIGFLFWDKNQSKDARTEVGSMLKTPRCPVWLTSTNNQIGLLFSNNIDLVSDWRSENRFVLYYYTGLPSHQKCELDVETRHGRQIRGRTQLTRKQEEDKIPQLEQCIMTKWYGAAVDWGNCSPFY